MTKRGLIQGELGGLLERGLSRRAFLAFCGAMTALLALPPRYVPRVAAAVSGAPKIPLIWLRGSGCGGDGEALLRTTGPGAVSLLLESLSVDYLEILMASAGEAASDLRAATIAAAPNGYLAVIEGAISNADDGYRHTVGGRPFRDVAREVSAGASGVIAVGSCAFDGGLAAAGGGSIGAGGVGEVVAGRPFISLPGCPVNAANLAATIVHFLTFGELPPADGRGRPLFAYGSLIHNQCERRPHFEFGEFVEDWGDEGAQKGWCLYKMGCKGPEAYANCPTVRYDEGASWPIGSGQVCIACTMPGFWDSMGPAFRRLPPLAPFLPWLTADVAGQVIVGGTAGLAVAHGTASIVRAGVRRRRAARARLAEEAPETAPVAPPVAEPEAPPVVAPTEPAPEGTPVEFEPETAELEPPAEPELEAPEPVQPPDSEDA